MPDAAGNIKGIALSGRAGETLDKIKRRAMLEEISAIGQELERRCGECNKPATDTINGMDVCEGCWERGMGLD